jgi:WD40 repeat protein
VLACAILAAAGVIPFALASPAKTPSQANSPGAAKSASHGGQANPPSYSRVGIDLPSPFAGNSVSALAFSPSGAGLAIADIYICLWDIAAKGCTTASALTDAHSVAFSPGGRTLAAGNADGSTDLRNFVTNEVTARLADPASKGVNSVAFSPDGRTLAAGDFNGHTYLWNVTAGKVTAIFTDPGGKGVNSVAFGPDGKTLAAGDGNGRTYLWNVTTGELTATLADPGGPTINSVAFSPDGKTLATGDESGGVSLWHVS